MRPQRWLREGVAAGTRRPCVSIIDLTSGESNSSTAAQARWIVFQPDVGVEAFQTTRQPTASSGQLGSIDGQGAGMDQFGGDQRRLGEDFSIL